MAGQDFDEDYDDDDDEMRPVGGEDDDLILVDGDALPLPYNGEPSEEAQAGYGAGSYFAHAMAKDD